MTLLASNLPADPLALSAHDAVELAKATSLDFYSQSLALDAAHRDLENSWNLFLPGVSVGATAKYGDSLLIKNAKPSSQEAFSSSLTAGLRLSLASSIIFDQKNRQTDYRSAEIGEQDAVARLTRDVQKAYYFLVSLKLDIDNKATAVTLASDRVKLASARFNSGMGSELDLLRARMSESNARSSHQRTITDYEKRQASFRRMVGLVPGETFNLSSALEVPANPVKLSSDPNLEGRADLQKASMAVQAAESAITRYVTINRLPLLSIDAAWNYSLTDRKTSKDAYSLSAGLTFNPDAWIPGSRKDLELKRLLDSKERLTLAYEQAKRAAFDEIEALKLDIDFTRDNLTVAEGQISLAERILVRTREAYDRGVATSLELDEAQLAVDSARQSLIALRYQYLSLLIDLGYALNLPWQSLVE
jgi:outer membrane protein TolC